MLTEATLKEIDTLHVADGFVALFRPYHCEEAPMFLLAVRRYKRNPTWDSLRSVYQLHVSDKGPHQANLPGEATVRLKEFLENNRLTHNDGLEPADPRVFDVAYDDVLSKFANDLATNTNMREGFEAFLKQYNIPD